MKKTIIQIICGLLVVALAFGISWLIGKGIPPNADAGPPTQIEHTHSFGDWQTTKEATCTEAGSETRTCECGYFEERELAALGHDYVDGVCSRCGEVDPEYIPPCGHSSERKETTLEATCTEPGKAKIYCEECGELLREETIPAKGHGILSETITAATCTQNGIDRHYCIYCNEKFETYETSALGHKYVNGTCSRCGAIDSSVYALKVSACKTYSAGYINYQDPGTGHTVSDCKFVWQTGNGVVSMVDQAYKRSGFIYSEFYFKITFTSGSKTLTFGTDSMKDTLTSPVVSNVKTGNSNVNNFFVNGEHYSVQFQIYNTSFSKKFTSAIFEFDYNKNYAYWFTVSAT